MHRPRVRRLVLPQGQARPRRARAVAAVREVAEETGLHVRLGPPLARQRYPTRTAAMKTVSYWAGRVVGDDDVERLPRQRRDRRRRVGAVRRGAATRLTYAHDRDTLREALAAARRKTQALVVLRHGEARSRKAWRQDDRLRPLLAGGPAQAQRLVPLLAAYDVTRVVSSSSTRCVETVGPYADVTGWQLELEDGAERGGRDRRRRSLEIVDDLLARRRGRGAVHPPAGAAGGLRRARRRRPDSSSPGGCSWCTPQGQGRSPPSATESADVKARAGPCSRDRRLASGLDVVQLGGSSSPLVHRRPRIRPPRAP